MTVKKYVINRNRQATGFPTLLTAVCWLLLDRFHPPGWVVGVVWTFVALLWIGCIASVIREEQFDPFPNRQ